MREYWKNMKIPIIILAALIAAGVIVFGARELVTTMTAKERNNDLCTTTERVFDEADVLTDRQEEKLRRLINKRERQTGCDIVLVTLNESLEEYARSEDPYVSYDKFVMIYADNFYDEHAFGYNRAYGNGVLLLDNWYREDDGSVYTWFSTTGEAYERYSDSMIDHLLDKVYDWIEISPYRAYRQYINQFYHDMTGFAVCNVDFFYPGILIISLLVSGIFLIMNFGSKSGEKTTRSNTYVAGGVPHMNQHKDQFIRKTVSQHKIDTGSHGGGGGSRGGGGGHVSSGGVSHGGGGHSR